LPKAPYCPDTSKGATAINLNKSSAERRTINTDEDCHDMMYWSIKFGVSMEKLSDAITKVGPLVMNVERHLSCSTAVMAAPSAANPDRYAAGLWYGSIGQPDTTAFVVRNDSRPQGAASGF
jgi:Protein of unknown function (DUF3606)